MSFNVLSPSPSQDEVRFRPFAGREDFAGMLAVLRASKAADGIDDADTLAGLARRYAQLDNCDPATDMVMLESQGELIGYGRTAWSAQAGSETWLYDHMAYLQPAWRRRGLGGAMLGWLEQRALAKSREQGRAPQTAAFHQVFSRETESAKAALLASAGYALARYFFQMQRPDLEGIPVCPLPPGLELRPVRARQLRAIWAANVEAFRDHWSEPERSEAEYESWLENGEYQPEIWKVAWDSQSNEVAGMVLGYIDHEQNKRQRRRRGMTENICVRRPWRRRGLAHALIAANLRELKARGMREATLTVDSDNLTGALTIYERMGFRVIRRDTMWRKAMPLAPDKRQTE